MISNLLNQGRGICLNHSLKGVSSVTLIVCSVEWVQTDYVGSNKNTLWYSTNRQQVVTTSSGGQKSNPLKSSSQITFHAFAQQSIWGCEVPGAHSPFLQLGLHWWPQHQVCCHCSGHRGFLVEGMWVSHAISYHHDYILTTLSQLCVHILYSKTLWQRAISSL